MLTQCWDWEDDVTRTRWLAREQTHASLSLVILQNLDLARKKQKSTLLRSFSLSWSVFFNSSLQSCPWCYSAHDPHATQKFLTFTVSHATKSPMFLNPPNWRSWFRCIPYASPWHWLKLLHIKSRWYIPKRVDLKRKKSMILLTLNPALQFLNYKVLFTLI